MREVPEIRLIHGGGLHNLPVYQQVLMAHQIVILRCMGTPQSFSAMFSKGDNFCEFLFAYLEDEVFSK